MLAKELANRPRRLRSTNRALLDAQSLRRPTSIYSIGSEATVISSIDSFNSSGFDDSVTCSLSKRKPIGGSWLELFYDLFFAASLSAFSRAREISSRRELADLAAFFTILWWTWASQTMFDVRFAKYQKAEQAIKFFQLSIMIGYGVFEGDFSLFASETESAERIVLSDRRRAGPKVSAIAIAVLFILSRLQLSLQYFLLARRQRNKNREVLMIKAMLALVAALTWLISFFFLNQEEGRFGIFGIRTGLWMTGILIEVAGTFLVRLSDHVGFEKTHLTERFGSLTIILLGEGVIKLVSVLRDIHSGVGFSAKSAIAIVAAVFAFFLLWALYFDDFDLEHRLGKLRAYTWAYLHYFFHLSLVLSLDGITSLLLFTNISGGISALLDATTENTIMEDLFNLRAQAPNGTNFQNHITLGTLSFDYDPLTTIMSQNSVELSSSQYSYAFIQLFTRIVQSYNVKPSLQFMEYVKELVPSEVSQENVQQAFKLLLKQFIVSAQFFTIAGGLIFWSMIPIMVLQGRIQPRRWTRYVPLVSRFLVGGVLIGVAGLADTGVQQLARVLESGFLVPSFACAAALLYGADRIVLYVSS